jgi:hypothetical protein
MRKLIALLVFTYSSLLLLAQVPLHHTPPQMIDPDQPAVLTVEFDGDFNAVTSAYIMYRPTGAPSYTALEMEKSEGVRPSFTVTLPAGLNTAFGLEYYFRVAAGDVYTLPASQPDVNPFRVQGARPADTNAGFVLLSPEPGMVEGDEPIMIAVSMFALGDDLDPSSIHIIVNGEDRTGDAEIAGSMMALSIDPPANGSLNFKITATDKNGRRLSSPTWNNKVHVPKFEMPLGLNGRIIGTAGLTDIDAKDSSALSDRDDRRADVDFTMNGQYRRFGFDTRIFLSDREKSNEQSVNRYRLGLEVPHLKVILGDDTPTYSTFTLSNKNIRGIHARVQNLDLGLQVDYGETRRKIDGKLSVTGDTLSTAGTFKRNTTGLRLELGNMRKMIWGISAVKTKDDVGSLDDAYIFRTAADSTRLVSPIDNIVMGSDITLFLLNQHVTFGIEGALSLYNRDTIDGVMTKDELEDDLNKTLPFDPESYENIIIINTNLEPFKPDVDCTAERIFTTANVGSNYLSASYTLVGSSFNAVSANYLQKNTKTISVADNLGLFRQQLMLTLGYNRVSDNLSTNKTTEKSATSTTTDMIFGQVMIRPYGLPTLRLGYQTSGVSDDGDYNYLTYSSGTTNNAVKLQYVDQESRHFSIGLTHDINQIMQAPTQVGIAFDQSNSKDNLNELTDNSLNAFSLYAKSDFRDLPLSTNISYSLSQADNKTRSYTGTSFSETQEIEDSYNTFGIRTDLHFFDRKLTPYVEWQMTTIDGDSDSQGRNLIEVGSGYKVTDNFFISGQAGLLKYANDEDDSADYDKLDCRIRATYRF